MQAILLATGETQKLRPLTDNLPAPLLPLANRPVMAYNLELLGRAGIRNVIVCLSHLGGSIEARFGSGARWGMQLEYVLQRDALGSAGALQWARRLIHDAFVVLPADSIIDLDVEDLCRRHLERMSLATVVVHPAPLDPTCRLWLDEHDRVISRGGSPSEPAWYDTGAYVFAPHVLDFVPARTKFDIHNQLIPTLLENGLQVEAFPLQGYWNPLASFQSLYDAQRVFFANAMGSSGLLDVQVADLTKLRQNPIGKRQIAPGIWAGRNHTIHKSADLSAPLFIGENSWIGREVELGPEVVVGAHVVIDDQATIRRSIVLDNTYIGRLVNIENRVVQGDLVIDIPTGANVHIADRHLLGHARLSVLSASVWRLFELGAVLSLGLLALPVALVVACLAWLGTGAVFYQLDRAAFAPDTPGTQDKALFVKGYRLFRFNTRRADGRPTRIGSWLERWELNRLPELWNILAGNLRLVGVVPLSEEQVSQAVEPWQRKRFESRPGFTGLWYVQTNLDSSLDELLVIDGYYASTRTWRGDLRLALQTPAAWFRRVTSPRSSSLPIPLEESAHGD